MSRMYHIMKPNENTEIPTYHAFIDTETRDHEIGDGMKELSLKVGWCCFMYYDVKQHEQWKKWVEFTRSKDVWEWIDKKLPYGERIWVWAHNMDFDFRVCKGFTELEKLGYTIKSFVFEPGRVIVKWIKPGKTIMIVDTLNIFKVSLEALGESMGIKKMDVEFDSVTDEALSAYCKNDVEIIVKAISDLLEFIDENDLGSFKPTVAAQAFAAYKHKYMKYPIYVHNNKTADEMEVAAYKGGRTEAFFIGNVKHKRLRCLDVNSMYPSIMVNKELPNKLIGIKSDVRYTQLIKFMKKYLVIADMEFFLPVPGIGCKRERLTFPTGNIRETITSPEIEYVLRHGVINRIYRVCLYEHKPIYKDYIEKVYALRHKYKEEGNYSYQLFCKYLLNALYGKFGQRIQKYEDVGIDCKMDDNYIFNYYDADLKKRVTEYHFGGKIWMKGPKGPSFDTFSAIPAFITAYARMYLWELIEKAGREKVYYCDTDSLFTKLEGVKRLSSYLDEKKLGYLGIENKKIMRIRNVKDYDTKEERKIKGVRKDAKKIGFRRFEQIQFEKLNTGSRNDRAERVVIKKVHKKMKREYLKGIVLKCGRVRPFEVKEW